MLATLFRREAATALTPDEKIWNGIVETERPDQATLAKLIAAPEIKETFKQYALEMLVSKDWRAITAFRLNWQDSHHTNVLHGLNQDVMSVLPKRFAEEVGQRVLLELTPLVTATDENYPSLVLFHRAVRIVVPHVSAELGRALAQRLDLRTPDKNEPGIGPRKLAMAGYGPPSSVQKFISDPEVPLVTKEVVLNRYRAQLGNDKDNDDKTKIFDVSTFVRLLTDMAQWEHYGVPSKVVDYHAIEVAKKFPTAFDHLDISDIAYFMKPDSSFAKVLAFRYLEKLESKSEQSSDSITFLRAHAPIIVQLLPEPSTELRIANILERFELEQIKNKELNRQTRSRTETKWQSLLAQLS